ncbi:MAG: phospholipase [Comamonadaceae bacterium]|nr:phospholipase [Comamonadaceae bacterium]
MRFRTRSLELLASVALAAGLAGCGGGGADTTPRTTVSAVKVMGDSLADIGAFGGVKATIQGNDMYPERISQTYGLGKGCNYFVYTGATFVANSNAGCTNYAIGGGVINPASSRLAAADPRGIGVQFATATAAGNFAPGDLLVVDGGGNDAAALVTAYLRAGQPAPAGDGGASYLALIGTQLSAAQVQAAAAGGAAGLAAAGATYMTALAGSFYTTIKTGALDKGATRIVLVNMPAITVTPRFQAVLDGIALANGANGAAARAQAEALFKGWFEAFNAELARRFAGNAGVAIVDAYKAFNDMVTIPAQFGFTDVVHTACPSVGVGADGLPTYSFPTCTDAALQAKPPAGAAVGSKWYATWAFSDGFHPTPYAHQQFAELIALALARAGWL